MNNKQQPSAYRWMLIDYPQAEQAPVEAAKAGLLYFWWYKESRLEQSLSLSPVWVNVPPGHEFAELYPDAPLFYTDADFFRFQAHMKSLLIMRGPDNKPLMLRFYNPLYLTLWLKQLEPQRLTELLGPVATVQWSYQGQSHQLDNPSPESEPRQYDLAWFTVTEQDWSLLQQVYRQQAHHQPSHQSVQQNSQGQK